MCLRSASVFWHATGGDATTLIDCYIPGYDEIDTHAADLALCPLTADPLEFDCPGDLDGDDDVDCDDLNVLLANCGATCGGNPTFWIG